MKLSKFVAILLCMVILGTIPSGLNRVSQASQPVSPVSINNTLFISTLPSTMTIGQNYTVKVLVMNNLNTTLGIIIRVVAPLNYILVNPLSVQILMGPGQTLIQDFVLIPHNPYSGSLNVSAIVWIANSTSGSTPVEVASVSGFVNYIRFSEVSRLAIFATVFLVIVVVLLVVYRYYKRNNQRSSQVIEESPSLTL